MFRRRLHLRLAALVILLSLTFMGVSYITVRFTRAPTASLPVLATSYLSGQQRGRFDIGSAPPSIITLAAPHVLSNRCTEIETLSKRLLRNYPRTISAALHQLYLYGRIDGCWTNESAPILDRICHVDTHEMNFNHARAISETRYGLRFSLANPAIPWSNQRATESHSGQGLSVFACVGVPLGKKIVMSSGRTRYVDDILKDLTANFVLDGEIEWETVAICLYLPPKRSWTNKFGITFTFDDLATELIGRKWQESSCAGTHRLIALTTLIRVDQEQKLLKNSVRHDLVSFLTNTVSILTNNQRPDGAWTNGWWERPASTPAALDVDSSFLWQLTATGHHLEWLILLPLDLLPKEKVFKGSGEWTLRALKMASEDPDWCRVNFCAVTHALRSLYVIGGVKSSAVPDSDHH
jgi:hypothetical protein